MRHVLRHGHGLVAVDLGTARTRIAVGGRGIVADEPTVVAYTDGGEVLAAGHSASAAAGDPGVRLMWPVRRGVLVDPVSGVHVLRLLLRRARVDTGSTLLAVTSVASSATIRDASVASAAVASATGGSLVPVSTELAAAVGAGVDTSQEVTNLVCDVGAGVIEISVTSYGCLLASFRLGMSSGEFDESPDRILKGILSGLEDVLAGLPPQLASSLATRPVVLVGGGALRPGLAAELGAAWRSPVRVPPRARDAVVLGLSACLEQARQAHARRPIASSGAP